MLCKDEGYCYRCSAVCVSLCISRGRSISHLGRGTFWRTCTDPLSEELQRNAECNECGPLQKSLRRRQYDLSLSLRCQFVYWHCPRNKRSWVYVTVWRPSVRPSVLPSVCRVIRRLQRLWHSAATAPQHGAQQQMLAVSC